MPGELLGMSPSNQPGGAHIYENDAGWPHDTCTQTHTTITALPRDSAVPRSPQFDHDLPQLEQVSRNGPSIADGIQTLSNQNYVYHSEASEPHSLQLHMAGSDLNLPQSPLKEGGSELTNLASDSEQRKDRTANEIGSNTRCSGKNDEPFHFTHTEPSKHHPDLKASSSSVIEGSQSAPHDATCAFTIYLHTSGGDGCSDLGKSVDISRSGLADDESMRKSCLQIGSWVAAEEPATPRETEDEVCVGTPQDDYQYPKHLDNETLGGYIQCAGGGSGSQSRSSQNNQHTRQSEDTGRNKLPEKKPRKGKKRMCENDEDEEDDDQKSFVSGGSCGAKKPKSGCKFVCPFQWRLAKLLPINDEIRLTYRVCTTTKFDDVARLKEHLLRVHNDTPCPRCQKPFKDEQQVRQHLIEDNRCDVQEPSGMNLTAQEKEVLSKMNKVRGLDSDKWNQIFLILFPNQQPPSPHDHFLDYCEPHSCQQASAMIPPLETVLPDILWSKLDPALTNFMVNENQKAHLRSLIVEVSSSLSARFQQLVPHHSVETVPPQQAYGSASMHSHNTSPAVPEDSFGQPLNQWLTKSDNCYASTGLKESLASPVNPDVQTPVAKRRSHSAFSAASLHNLPLSSLPQARLPPTPCSIESNVLALATADRLAIPQKSLFSDSGRGSLPSITQEDNVHDGSSTSFVDPALKLQTAWTSDQTFIPQGEIDDGLASDVQGADVDWTNFYLRNGNPFGGMLHQALSGENGTFDPSTEDHGQ